MPIHTRVKEVRLMRGVTQKHLAKLVSLSQASYHYREAGKSPFRAQELQIIARELGVMPSIFFDHKVNELRIKSN